jgi:uncharacterized protein with HEPN domain
LTAQALVRVVRAVFPRLNDWLNCLPDPRVQEMCVYVDYDIIWSTVTENLPPLVAELERIL